jgi:hypothetical protein
MAPEGREKWMEMEGTGEGEDRGRTEGSLDSVVDVETDAGCDVGGLPVVPGLSGDGINLGELNTGL